ncbi:DUF6568 family protein [Candidatus Enterococcus mansonii]|uniref:Thioredoxin domain-containing protein n=1 Tax=Candidatus Enterococcus mansonii TaxID=1834181 RepID=A0ABU8IF83_9ENTE
MNPHKEKQKTTMLILCLGLFIVLILAGVTILSEKNKVKQVNESLKIEQTNIEIYQDVVSFPLETFEYKFSKGDLMLVYMGNFECSDCSTFSPVFKEKFKKHNLKNKLIYVECSYLRSNKSEWLKFKEKYSFKQTPSFIIYKNSSILSSIEWDDVNGLNEETFDNWLLENKKIIDTISL